MSTEELKNQLVDVRKAYRLIFSYQKRVLSTVKYISDNLGFKYNKDIAYFMDKNPKSLSCSGWDWLNMYLLEFRMNPLEKDGKKLHLSILLLSDTAIFEDGLPMESVEEFEDAEQTKTKLVFIFSDVELKDNHFLTFLDDRDIFDNKKADNEYDTAFDNPFDGHAYDPIEEPHKALIKRYNLSEFLNQQETDEILEHLQTEVSDSFNFKFKE